LFTSVKEEVTLSVRSPSLIYFLGVVSMAERYGVTLMPVLPVAPLNALSLTIY